MSGIWENNSGKTTYGNLRPASSSADRSFFEALVGLIDPSLPESKQQNENIVRQYCAVARGFSQDGYMVVMDGVIGPWMLGIVSDFFTEFRYAILHPDLETVLARGAFRQEKQVNPESISKMHMEFAMHFPGFEPYYFVDSSGLTSGEKIPAFPPR